MLYLTIWRRSCFIFAAIFNQVLLCVPECLTEAGNPQCFFSDAGTFRVACRWSLNGRWSKKEREKIWSHKKIYKQYEVSDVTGLLPNEMFRTNLVTHGASYMIFDTQKTQTANDSDDIIRTCGRLLLDASVFFLAGVQPVSLPVLVHDWTPIIDLVPVSF